MYVCGPTVYGHSHIGHGKSYVSFDVIVRYLRYIGYNITYVQNITDVGHLLGETNEGEDRMLKQSRAEHKHPMEVAEFYTRSYFEDMDKLNVLRPDISPRATGHIIEQIELVQTLIKKDLRTIQWLRIFRCCNISRLWKTFQPHHRRIRNGYARRIEKRKTTSQRFRFMETRRTRTHYAMDKPKGQKVFPDGT